MRNIKKSVPYITSDKSWYYQHCLQETYKIFLDISQVIISHDIVINRNAAPLSDCVANKELKIILGGDFNVTLDSGLDCSGGRPFTKDSVKNIQNLCFDFDLVDIWRIRNPERSRFTWRQKKPFYSKETWLLVKQWCLPRRGREVWHCPVDQFRLLDKFLQLNSIEKSGHVKNNRRLRELNISPLYAFRLLALTDALPLERREGLKTISYIEDEPFNIHDEIKLNLNEQTIL